jgi:NitT/TauT family transport system ATP-binding protein
MIDVDAISFSFEKEKILSRISFQVGTGEIVGILGPSGVGKTTLLRCIAGLLKPESGQITIDDFAPAKAAQLQKIGYLFQEDSLLEWRTVEENVGLPFEVRARTNSWNEDRKAVLNSLEMVGLRQDKKKFPSQLSGGMRQRAALARALVSSPSILLLDEPFAAIDLLTRERIMVELHRILRDARTPTILVTHHLEEAVFLSDRLVLLGGRPASVVDVTDVDLGKDRTENLLLDSRFMDVIISLKRKLRSIPWSKI